MRSIRMLPLVALLALAHSPITARAGSVALSKQVPADLDSLVPPGLSPYIVQVETRPAAPHTGAPTVLVITGEYPYRCGMVYLAKMPDLGHVVIRIRQATPCTDSISTRPGLWLEGFHLGLLPAGIYRTEIELSILEDPAVPPGTDPSIYRGTFEFTVAQDDTTPPPPPPPPPHLGPLPYVDLIRIGPKPNMLPIERPICPDDSIMVTLAGHFPNTCFSLKAIQLVRVPTVGFAPAPPIVRIIVDSTGCSRPPCAEVMVPWRRAVLFEPLPPSSYRLQAQLAAGSCLDSVFPEPQYEDRVPFEVVPSCSTYRVPCVVGTFDHPNGRGQCDASISPDHPAVVTLLAHPSVPLSGLQGELRIDPPGLTIARIAPTGPAEGMHLSWAPIRGGARFVLFAERGAPIPPAPWPGDTTPVPVLRVAVTQPPGVRAPAVTWVRSDALLGSDVYGQGIPLCQIPWERIDGRLFAAQICAERECDFNGDGQLDVRDLVLMVRCLNRQGPCPDSSRGTFNCNHDSTSSIEDVICCARKILEQDRCPDCPPDTTAGRREPSIAITMGGPESAPLGLTLPITLLGAYSIGAARLVLDYPVDRFEGARVELGSYRGDWLDLYQDREGRVVVGLIRTGGRLYVLPDDRLDMVLHLTLRPGQSPGGSVTAVEGEFSGRDGVKLEVDLGRPSQRLSGPARLTLSEARPNPSSGETSFSLTLDRSATVEVGVYDVTGRLVASLYRGRLGAGTREFAWNGLSAGVTQAASGVYFYRAASEGRTVSRRMVLLRMN